MFYIGYMFLHIPRSTFLFFFVFTIGFLSCNPTKKAVVYADDRSFYSLLKKVRKDPSEPEKRKSLVTLFGKVKELHEQAVSRMESNGLVPPEYDPLLQEYNALQKLMNETSDSPIRGMVVLSDYTNQVAFIRETAATFYYQRGLEELRKDTRVSATAAYDLFGRVQRYISAFRDVNQLKNMAYERSIVNILINPVQQGILAGSTPSGSFSDRLVRDLGGRSATAFRARFFSQYDLFTYAIRPDWIVDLLWNHSQVPNRILAKYDRLVTKDIQIGKDTSGRPVFRPIYATLHIVRYESAPLEVDFRIVDIEQNITLDWSRLQLGNRQTTEAATFSGDSRAISDADWQLINRDPNARLNDQSMQLIYNQLLEQIRTKIRTLL
jgi:hypothetical protein